VTGGWRLPSMLTVTEDALVVDLVDGRTVSVPLPWYPRLAHGTPAERANWRLIGRGEGVHWPDLDEDISVAGSLPGTPRARHKAPFGNGSTGAERLADKPRAVSTKSEREKPCHPEPREGTRGALSSRRRRSDAWRCQKRAWAAWFRRSGEFVVAPYTVNSARPEATAIVERLRERTPPEAV